MGNCLFFVLFRNNFFVICEKDVIHFLFFPFSIQDQDKKLQELWRICNKLPKHFHANFRYVCAYIDL